LSTAADIIDIIELAKQTNKGIMHS